MAILYLGIDLAKNVFAVHGVNAAGKPELIRPKVARAKLHELIASLQPCTGATAADFQLSIFRDQSLRDRPRLNIACKLREAFVV